MAKLRVLVSTMAAAAVAFVLSSGVALADSDGHMWDGHDHMWGWGGGWWILMMVIMVLSWAAVIALAVWAVSHFTGARVQSKGPLDIAKERLARGEISQEEFEQLRQKLG